MPGRLLGSIKRNLVTGLITVIPLWVTWVVLELVFNQLSRLGRPWVRALARRIDDDWPQLAEWLLEPALQNVAGVVVILILLYLLGLLANRVVGREIVAALERAFYRIPLVETVYGAVKKLVAALQQQPEGVQRVVLIAFPSPEMRTVGLVTKTFVDDASGLELAAVYVPTTPNPTSGYLEIVPVRDLVSTEWSIEEAMNFIMSGGAVAPGRIRFQNASAGEPPEQA